MNVGGGNYLIAITRRSMMILPLQLQQEQGNRAIILFMKIKKQTNKEGIIFKGAFCPYWGGVMYSKSKRFFSGGLKNISATLLANQHNNGVVEVYEEDIKCD